MYWGHKPAIVVHIIASEYYGNCNPMYWRMSSWGIPHSLSSHPIVYLFHLVSLCYLMSPLLYPIVLTPAKLDHALIPLHLVPFSRETAVYCINIERTKFFTCNLSANYGWRPGFVLALRTDSQFSEASSWINKTLLLLINLEDESPVWCSG